MERSLVEAMLIVGVGYLLYLKYRQTKMGEYLYSAFFLAFSYILSYVTESKLPVYACFLILAALFFRIWKKSS